MNWDMISPIVISVGVVAAAIAAIANVIVALMNNIRLKAIEKDKRISELIQYRYTKLYSLLEDLEREHGFIVYIDEPNKTLSEVLEKRIRFIEIYKLSKPLINNDLRKNLDVSALSEQELWKPLLAGLMPDNTKLIENDLHTYVKSINAFHDELGKAITAQISNLLI